MAKRVIGGGGGGARGVGAEWVARSKDNGWTAQGAPVLGRASQNEQAVNTNPLKKKGDKRESNDP